MSVYIKRIYETVSPDDGYRILVDRLWPRGMVKEEVQIDEWLKEIAPSSALRKWFDHKPEKWASFGERYRAELYNSSAMAHLMALKRKYKTLTLLYSAKDKDHNHAIILKELLQ